MRGKITKAAVDSLQKGDILADTEVKGFVARRLPSGVVTYGLRYRVAGNKQRWFALGLHGRITPEQARKSAKKRVGEVADDRDPASDRKEERKRAKEAATSTVDALLDAFLERHVRKNLRSADEVERIFNVYVRPRIGSRSIYEIRRSDVVEMLDAIEDENGPVMADRTLANVRKAFTWYATRDDRFNSPIIRGMARTRPAERARKRVLDDQEIRDLWKALDPAEMPSCFPAFVRTLLLTAQRRSEVSDMTWDEVAGNVWTIPAERGDAQGHKTGDRTGDKVVPLSAEVLALLGTPQKGGFVFSTTHGEKAFSGYSKAFRALNERIAAIRAADERKHMPHWTLHDLRRTARSLMSRAGVSADIAERVLGHVIPGVRGVYDRHSFIDEKRDAVDRLARLVTQILDQPTGNLKSVGS
jgi:integrase